MEKSIRRFCQIDPLMFFAFPPKEAPVPPPTLDLHIYPPLAEFIEFGGASKHVLTNAGSSRMVFKVKCSNNSLFKVSPVYAFLDPGASMDLQILRQEGPTRNDKLIIMYKEAKRTEKDPKKSFENEGVTAKKVLPLITRVVEES
ncbi:Major sperm protein [Trichostrongylus colubriformis]|uniref:Major sperm protein n=1 Tax=Trichostrongylus colubriformis TaxID=6319 RepID=A0AAN8FAN0_TRICO